MQWTFGGSLPQDMCAPGLAGGGWQLLPVGFYSKRRSILRKRNKMQVALVPCPLCGQPMGPQVQAMVQQAGGRKRQLRTKQRRLPNNGWSFETTAEAVALTSKPKWTRPEPKAEIAAPMSDAPLSPGEKRESKTYRARSLADIWPPLVWRQSKSCSCRILKSG